MAEHSLASFCTNTTGGLSRLWCENCQEERIHKGFTCVCGATHQAYPVRSVYTRSISVTPKRAPKVFPLLLKGSNPPRVKVEANQHVPSWQQAPRDAQVVARYAAGEGASAIASAHKLSAERVRQILRAAGVWKGVPS